MANAQLCIKLLSSESSLLFHSTLEGVFSQRSLEMRATRSCSPEDSLKPHPKEAHPVGSGMAQEFLAVFSSPPQVILIMEILAPEQTVWSELLQPLYGPELTLTQHRAVCTGDAGRAGRELHWDRGMSTVIAAVPTI